MDIRTVVKGCLSVLSSSGLFIVTVFVFLHQNYITDSCALSRMFDKVKRREKLFGHFQVILIFLFKKNTKKDLT